MSEMTNIEWASSTFNPWCGCRRVSPGCKNCYMFALLERWGKDPTRRTRTKDWKKVLRWNRDANPIRGIGPTDASYAPGRPRVFPSLCDWLDSEVPIEWLADFLKLIHDTPNLDWLLLTKRPENFTSRLSQAFEQTNETARWIMDWVRRGNPPPNTWIGTSVEDQKRADERIPLLLQIPAKIRFLSVEPLLEKVELGLFGTIPKDIEPNYRLTHQRIQWGIVGGESGGKRRDCGVEAIHNAVLQFVEAGVPCFTKQDCALKPGQRGRISDDIWALKQFPSS